MRIITRAFWFFACNLVLELCGCAHLSQELSQSEIASIKTVVTQETSEPIISIGRQASGVVRVETGVIRGPLNGGGWTYFLKRSGSTWKVKKAVGWAT